MKRKLFIILSTLVLIITLLFSFVFKDNKENNKEISKVKRLLSKPEGIEAYTLNGEKTNKEFNDLINNYVLDKIICKNGTIATYNKATNEVSLSNIHMPDYCTMNFSYTIYGKLLADNPTIKTRTVFSSVFTETNTGTLYKSTESIAGSTPKEVYYFAGNAKNNWVKFAGYYWRIIRTNHDGSVRLLYAGTSPDTTEGYISTNSYNSDSDSPKYVGYMYGGDDSLLSLRTNINDSTIKTYIDNWYKNNLIGYTKYLSKDAVYCNDRQLDNGQTWTYVTNTSNQIKFVGYSRIDRDSNGAKANPTHNCAVREDSFSVSTSGGGNGKLTYPIALMTADEVAFAGSSAYNPLNSPYTWYYNNSNGESIVNNKWWFTMTPMTYIIENYMSSIVWDVGGNVTNSNGRFGNGHVLDQSEVSRPVISIKGNLIWKSGDGSSASPYEVEDLPPTLSEKLLADNPTIKTRTDFSSVFTETNTGTLYKSTESIAGSTPKEVYYFAGDARNNWVKFGGYYWKIIRTNHDGSVRLLYSGTSPDTTEGYIGTSAFNTEFNSPKYVGYMYGEDDSTLDGIRANTKDSTIKTYIDNWYSNNLSAYTKYLSKDAVYCNDRQLDNGQTWTYATNQSSQIKFVGYSRIDRDGNGAKANPTYDCSNSKDAFSGSNIEAKLTYPIALITADELEFAGASTFNALVSPYTWYYNNSKGESIVNDKWWFTMTPLSFVIGEHVQSYVWDVAGKVPATPGRLGHGYVYGEIEEKARPVISIKSDALWSSGTGSPENPYEIIYN